MPKEIYPSSYICDCGAELHFFENTVRELKAMSHRKKVYLEGDLGDGHAVVFEKGKMIEMVCPLKE